MEPLHCDARGHPFAVAAAVRNQTQGQAVWHLLLFRLNRTVEYITPVIKHEVRSLQPLLFTGMPMPTRCAAVPVVDWVARWKAGTVAAPCQRALGAAECGMYPYLVKAKPGAVDALKRHREQVLGAYRTTFYPFAALDAS